MTNVYSAFQSVVSRTAWVMASAAAGLIAGVLISSNYLGELHEGRTAVAQQRADELLEAERADYRRRVNSQRQISNARHEQDAARYRDLVRTLDRVRDSQATAEMYLRATADSAAARAATAEKLLGDCQREYTEMARRAGLHALDLQDALIR